MTHAHAVAEPPFGRIGNAWSLADGEVTLEVEVPAGVEAQVAYGDEHVVNVGGEHTSFADRSHRSEVNAAMPPYDWLATRSVSPPRPFRKSASAAVPPLSVDLYLRLRGPWCRPQRWGLRLQRVCSSRYA
jgi:hypothetical protein